MVYCKTFFLLFSDLSCMFTTAHTQKRIQILLQREHYCRQSWRSYRAYGHHRGPGCSSLWLNSFHVLAWCIYIWVHAYAYWYILMDDQGSLSVNKSLIETLLASRVATPYNLWTCPGWGGASYRFWRCRRGEQDGEWQNAAQYPSSRVIDSAKNWRFPRTPNRIVNLCIGFSESRKPLTSLVLCFLTGMHSEIAWLQRTCGGEAHSESMWTL